MEPFNTEESGGSTIQRSAASARKTRLLGGYVSPLNEPARPVAVLACGWTIKGWLCHSRSREVMVPRFSPA